MSTVTDKLSTPMPPSDLAGNVPARDDALQIKVVGKRRPPTTPEESFRRGEILRKQMDLLNPFPRPRGFVFKAKTREEYEQWRRSQSNPRLW
jgi:hypothetical protein